MATQLRNSDTSNAPPTTAPPREPVRAVIPARGEKLASRFLQLPAGLRWMAFGAAIFVTIAVLRWSVIDSPPYFDCAYAVFSEANFLVETNFNYRRLHQDEPWGNDGGAKGYMISALPSFVALLMKATNTPAESFVTYRLFNFLCATIVVACAFALSCRLVSWPIALLVSLAIATTPIFAAQIDMLGMEMPMTAFALLAVVAMTRQHYATALLLAGGAFFMKSSGLIVAAAIALYLGALTLTNPRDWRATLRNAAFLTLAVALLIGETAIYRWSGLGDRLRRAPRLSGFLGEWSLICPDVMAITFLALLGGVFALYRGWRQVEPRRPVVRRVSNGFHELWRWAMASPGWVLSAMLLAAMLLAIARYIPVRCPRYFTLVVPFLYVVAALVLFRRLPARGAGLLLASIVAFNVLNLDGRFFPIWGDRNCPERSLEYLADHRSNIAALREVERQGQGSPVVAGHPLAAYLALPRLGYVERPVPGYCINDYSRPEFRRASALFDDPPREMIFVYVNNLWYRLGECTIPPPPADAEIIYHDRQPSPLIVYRQKLPESVAERRIWLLDHLWFVPRIEPPMLSLAVRAAFLANAGHADWGIRLLEKGVAAEPDNLDNRLELGRLRAQRGNLKDAAAALQEVLARDGNNWEANHNLGQILLSTASNAVSGHYYAGRADLLAARTEVDAHRRHELLSRARGHFETCLSLDPGNAAARLQLASALAGLSLHQAAVDEYRSLLSDKPDLLVAANDLAWLLATCPDAQVRDPAEALTWAQRAVDGTKPPTPGQLDTLAACYAAGGQYDLAIRTARAALAAAEQAGKAELVAAIRARLALYESRRPYLAAAK